MSIAHFSLTGVVSQINFQYPINELSLREAMGLTASYAPSQLTSLSALYEQNRHASRENLVTAIEDPELNFVKRWVCSQILAMMGDHRLNAVEPHMLPVSGGAVLLGLEPEAVKDVVTEFAEYGVLREWIEKETPTYSKTLVPFLLAKYPVTNAEYLSFLSDTSYSELPSSWPLGSFSVVKSNHPVYSVTPDACDAYVNWLSEKTGRQFRLPTEAEWEFAAAGSRRFEYPWGNDFAVEHANTMESGLLTTSCVGLFPKGNGPFGHCDLAGNVEEYVADEYQPYPNGPLIDDDLLINLGKYRVARGGSFTRFRDLARTKRRHGNYGSELYAMGFRIAESI